MNLKSLTSRIAMSTAFGLTSLAALAQDGIDNLERVGKPELNGTWMQPAIGDQAQTTHQLNDILMILCLVVVIFVSVLLVIVMVKFRDTGKEPKRFTHNTALEIGWTLVPVLILVVLAVFSVPALLKQNRVPAGDVVIKVTGYQWYWGYEYAEEGIAFDSYMLQKEELAEYGYQDDEYLLAVDNAVVVPVNADVVIEATAADVIHSWKIPAFAVQTDTVPGRLHLTWFNADKEGVYFGQCSELCGKSHAYMPIVVKVVSQEVYDQWLAKAKEEFASAPASVQVASN